MLSLGVELGHPALPSTQWDLLQVLPLHTLPTGLSLSIVLAGNQTPGIPSSGAQSQGDRQTAG